MHSSKTLIVPGGTWSRQSSQLAKVTAECPRALAHTRYSHSSKAALVQHALGSPALTHSSAICLTKAAPSQHTPGPQVQIFSNSSHSTKAALLQYAWALCTGLHTLHLQPAKAAQNMQSTPGMCLHIQCHAFKTRRSNYFA